VVASTPGKADKRRFYEQALTEAERSDLGVALDVEGFEQEIATLRLRLRSALQDREDLGLMLRGMDVLRRMVASRYGLSRGDRRNLSAFAQETARRLEERGRGDDTGDDA
jgi:hypothetical protein